MVLKYKLIASFTKVSWRLLDMPNIFSNLSPVGVLNCTYLITGIPPLTRFFGPRRNRVKGNPRYRRSILVVKPQNGEFET